MRRASRSGFGYAQVWSATRNQPERLYARELASALAWGAGLPVAIFASALLLEQPLLVLALPAVYALQVMRIAARNGLGSAYSWKYALLVMTAKLGEAWGALRYFLTSRSDQRFDYKNAATAERRAG